MSKEQAPHIRRPAKVDPDWKKKVGAVLAECGILDATYTGPVQMSVVNGGVASLEMKVLLR